MILGGVWIADLSALVKENLYFGPALAGSLMFKYEIAGKVLISVCLDIFTAALLSVRVLLVAVLYC